MLVLHNFHRFMEVHIIYALDPSYEALDHVEYKYCRRRYRIYSSRGTLYDITFAVDLQELDVSDPPSRTSSLTDSPPSLPFLLPLPPRNRQM